VESHYQVVQLSWSVKDGKVSCASPIEQALKARCAREEHDFALPVLLQNLCKFSAAPLYKSNRVPVPVFRGFRYAGKICMKKHSILTTTIIVVDVLV